MWGLTLDTLEDGKGRRLKLITNEITNLNTNIIPQTKHIRKTRINQFFITFNYYSI